MNKVHKKLIQIYFSIIGSIALWPTVIALLFLAFGFFMLYFERTPTGLYLENRLPFKFNTEPENARLVLSTIASGTITLMVFSFSMVMIVLSQASSNLTPRVIPGLINDQMNQVVLGVNIGTILYTLILLLGFKPGEDNASVPMLAILFTVLFALICVGFFVYFIHSISRAIKPDTILQQIYKKSLLALKQEASTSYNIDAEKQPQDTTHWFIVHNPEAGYLRHIEEESLNQLVQRHDLAIEVLINIGKFVIPGTPFLRISKDISAEKELLQEIQACFIFSLEEALVLDFESGLRQIMEVAVKALSPGINDPGTALNAIDFLILLLLERMKLFPVSSQIDENKYLRIIKRPAPLSELIYRYLAPIRNYGKSDPIIILKLLDSLQNLLYADREAQEFTKEFATQVLAIRDTAQDNIQNQQDRQQINERLVTIQTLVPTTEIRILSLS